MYFSTTNCNFDSADAHPAPIQLCGAARPHRALIQCDTQEVMLDSVKCHVTGLDSAGNLSVAARGNSSVRAGAGIMTRLIRRPNSVYFSTANQPHKFSVDSRAKFSRFIILIPTI